MLDGGQNIGKWTVQQVLRKSGTGVSYLCAPTEGGDLAVVKVFDHQSLHRGKERFQRFTSMLARLNHPGIPRYIGTVGDPPAIACAYVEGTFLNERLESGPLEPRQVLSLARELAATLSYLHGEDIVHRAIKSEAVYLTQEGQAQLMDFGVALESEEERLTQAGAVVGTLRILPPEAFESGREGPPYDLYALGVLLYEALTGQKAFGNPDGSRVRTTQVLQRKLSTPCLDPGEGVTPELRSLVQDLTRQDPVARPAVAMDVIHRLRGVRIKAHTAGGAGADLLANLKAARAQQAAAPAAAPPTPQPNPVPAPSPPTTPRPPVQPAPAPALAPRTSPTVQAPQAEPPPAAPIDRSLWIAVAAGGVLALLGFVVFLLIVGIG